MKIKGTAAFLSKNFLVLAAALFLISSASAACGNGTIGSGEDCDDGAAVDGDGCSAFCQYEVCDYPGLIGYWIFDTGVGNIAHDYSQSGNDGDLKNMDNSNWVSGKVGNSALEFDGTTEYVEVLNVGNFTATFNNLPAFSLEAWVYFDEDSGVDPDSDAIIQLNNDRTSPANHNIFYLKRITGNLLDLSTSDDDGVWDDLIDLVPIGNLDWHHIVATWNGSTKSIYIDGSPRISKTWEETLPGLGDALHIGVDEDTQGGSGLDDYFGGKIDEVAVFNRALSPEEISVHYNGGVGKYLCEFYCGNNVVEAGEECDGTDDAACPSLCQADCSCLSPTDFHIASFEISPNAVLVKADDTKAVGATVEVSNWGGLANAVVVIEVLKPDGTTMVLLPLVSKSVGSSAEVFGPGPPDNLSFDVVDSWESGLYAVYTRVYDASGDLHDSGVKYLSVGLVKPLPVPDFSILLLPLMLAFVLFVLRKK